MVFNNGIIMHHFLKQSMEAMDIVQDLEFKNANYACCFDQLEIKIFLGNTIYMIKTYCDHHQ